MSELSVVTLGPSGILAETLASPVPAVPDGSSMQQTNEELLGVVKQLSRDLSNHQPTPPETYSGVFDWERPATHFIDSLSSYTPGSLAMVLTSVVLLSGIVILAWVSHKKNVHQQEMLRAMSVPLEAFTAVVQQHSASTEMMGKRFEMVGDQLELVSDKMGSMVEGLTRLDDTVNKVVLHQKARDRKQDANHAAVMRGNAAAAQHG